jgi:hypothetical protein
MGKTRSRAYWTLPCIIPFLAACGGGGSGYGGSPSTSVTGLTGMPSSGVSTASSGSSDYPPASVQFATEGGPTFNGFSGNSQANVTFVAASRALDVGSGIRSAEDTAVTVIYNAGGRSLVRLAIPSLGVDEIFSENTDLRGFQGDTPYYGLNYVVLGEWAHWSGTRTTSYTESVFGYETPASAIPRTGTAQFSGWASGSVFKGTDSGAYVEGRANVSVDFTSGQVGGAFTNMKIGSSQPWNDVSLSGSIASGTNKFSGTTAVTSAPNNGFSLTGSATGRFDGGFYGPGAEQLGAVWTLTDGSGSAVGGVVGSR